MSSVVQDKSLQDMNLALSYLHFCGWFFFGFFFGFLSVNGPISDGRSLKHIPRFEKVSLVQSDLALPILSPDVMISFLHIVMGIFWGGDPSVGWSGWLSNDSSLFRCTNVCKLPCPPLGSKVKRSASYCVPAVSPVSIPLST